MRKYLSVLALAGSTALYAPAAIAGEEVLYQPIPAWVDEAELPDESESPGKPIRLLENQIFLADGQVNEYLDYAIHLQTPESLTQAGTQTADWQPDKGDLIVHRVELIRGDEKVDVLAGGAKFEVLRREAQLEKRIVDGNLTASLAVPGAQVGDVLRVSYSRTRRDQALDGEVQWSSNIPADPFPLASGRMRISWPEGDNIAFEARRHDIPELKKSDGKSILTVALPIAEPKDMPRDAPSRYRFPPFLQATSFDGWTSISAKMAPYFATNGTIAADGPIAEQIARIKAEHSDQRSRAAAALRVVQDEISYLLNGLDGGNYLPQSPAETWEKRYGDCKAKSLLLLAMLREMGISAEAVLVSSQTGDAVPELLPMPGVFDHMIVRADMDGTSLWLDGTTSGARLSNLDNIPRFHVALPLREGGADLQDIEFRPNKLPDQEVRVTVDQSAGLAVPALFDVEIVLRGTSASVFQQLAEMEANEQRDQAIYAGLVSAVGYQQIYDHAVSYDQEASVARISGKGVMTSPWKRKGERFEMEFPFQLINKFNFNNDRARQEWRDIPVVVNGPLYWTSRVGITLPQGGEGFELLKDSPVQQVIGYNNIQSDVAFANGKVDLRQSIQSTGLELPSAELGSTKRQTLRLKRRLPEMRSPVATREAWQYRGKDRKLLAEIEQAYAKLIEQAEPDEVGEFNNRAAFFQGIGDFEEAIADLDVVIEREASARAYRRRAAAKANSNDLEGALLDHQEADLLDPDSIQYGTQLRLLGILGRTDDVLSLAEDYLLIAEDEDAALRFEAFALGWSGQAQEGFDILQELVATSDKPEDFYNDLCWHAGTWNMVDDAVLGVCTQAVEQSSSSAAALDSRALALLRAGNFEQALADANAALKLEPTQHASRYLRGLIRVKLGDKAGQVDLDDAVHAAPLVKRRFAAYGLDG